MERRNIYSITPSLAFIYQVLNKDNYNYLPSEYKLIADKISDSFTYQDALDICDDLYNPKWNTVKLFLEKIKEGLTEDQKYDPEFLLDIFKKEVIEMKRGNATVLHAKNSGFLVLDIISQLVSGSYEGYKWKCLRNENDPEQKALSIYDEMRFSDTNNDNTPELRARLIAGNVSIFNNLFMGGESTFLFYFFEGSIGFPSFLIKDLQLSKKTTLSIIRLANKLNKINENILGMYSFPYSKMDIYVYPSIALGYKIENWNIFDYYDFYCDDKPWVNNFDLIYESQVRIIDLCFTKYAYEDGVRVQQFINTSKEELNKYLNELKKIVLSDKDLMEKISQRIDISNKPLKNPLESIVATDNIKNNGKMNIKRMEQYLEDLADIISENQDPIPYFEKKIRKSKSINLTKNYIEKILKEERWPEGEKIILESRDPKLIYEYATKIFKKRWPEGEQIILESRDPKLIYEYATKILKKRWPEGEQIILESRDPKLIYEYAAKILKIRWKEGEQIILESRDPKFIYEYARDVLKERWREGEQIILESRNPKLIYEYAYYFFNERWKEGEQIILESRDPKLIFEYAYYFLKEGSYKVGSYKVGVSGKATPPEVEKKFLQLINPKLIYEYRINHGSIGKWPEADKIILQSGDINLILGYTQYVIQERWPELENIILKSGDKNLIHFYAQNIIKGRWKEAEPIL